MTFSRKALMVDVNDNVIAGNEYRIYINYKAGNPDGDEVSGVVHAYLYVEEEKGCDLGHFLI